MQRQSFGSASCTTSNIAVPLLNTVKTINTSFVGHNSTLKQVIRYLWPYFRTWTLPGYNDLTPIQSTKLDRAVLKPMSPTKSPRKVSTKNVLEAMSMSTDEER